MIQLWIKIILVLFCAIALAQMLKRKEYTAPFDYIFWGTIWIGGALIIIYPEPISYISEKLNVGRAADLIIYLTIPTLFYMNYQLYKKTQELNANITKIVRTIAINQPQKKENPK